MKTELFTSKTFKPLGKKDNGRIYLFFGFGAILPFYLPAVTRFRKHGYSVVTFRFHTKAVLGFTIENLPKHIDEVCSYVSQLEINRKDRTQAVAIGNSMGSVFAWHAAKRVPTIEKVVANTGYALISKHIFEDRIGEHWRKKLVKDGHTQQSFHEAILSSEPITDFDKLKGKRVMLLMNRDDQVISFSNTGIFLKELEKHGIDHVFVENSNIRHGMAIHKNLLSKQLLDFIKY